MTDGLHRWSDTDRQPAAAQALTRPDDGLDLVRDGAVVASAALWWREPLAALEKRAPSLPTTSPLPLGEGQGEGHSGGSRAHLGAPPHPNPLPPGGGEGMVSTQASVMTEKPVGRIGHVAWDDANDGAALVAAATDALRAEGATVALGPLDGSTWFGYRVVTDPAPGGIQTPRFALEPWPAPAIADAFVRAGFAPVAHYLSSRVDPLPADPAIDADLDALRGVTVRPFRLADAEGELERLHPLLLRAFAANLFYAPLDRARFLALYRPLLAHIDPDLVLIADAGRQPVGVLLAIPDLAQAERGEAIDSIVIKTLAVDPERQGQGIGGLLVRAVQERARRRGFTSAVHALMHTDNASTRISRHLGTPIRRYALLGRTLGPR